MTRISMRLVCIFGFVLLISFLPKGNAGEVAKSTSSKTSKSTDLPLCIHDEGDLDTLKAHQKANQKKRF